MKLLLTVAGSKYSEWVCEFITRFNWLPYDALTVILAIFWMPFGQNQAAYLTTLKEIKKEIAPRIMILRLNR